MDLTEEELARVKRAYVGGQLIDHHEPRNRRAVRGDRAKLLKIAKLWNELDCVSRVDLQHEVAERCGGDPGEVDVGLAAMLVSSQPEGKSGAPKKVPGLRAVAKVLFQTWVNRGNPPEVGQLHQVRKDGELTPYPSLEFVAAGVLAVMPKIYERTREPIQRRRRLLVEVDTQLRDLRKKGEI